MKLPRSIVVALFVLAILLTAPSALADGLQPTVYSHTNSYSQPKQYAPPPVYHMEPAPRPVVKHVAPRVETRTVERVVEKPVYIEKIVEKPVERIVERIVERPVVRTRYVERPVYIERPVYRPAPRPVYRRRPVQRRHTTVVNNYHVQQQPRMRFYPIAQPVIQPVHIGKQPTYNAKTLSYLQSNNGTTGFKNVNTIGGFQNGIYNGVNTGLHNGIYNGVNTGFQIR